MHFPAGAIICINPDISPSAREHLIRQLFITEVMDGYVFDANVVTDPDYLFSLKRTNQRILVMREFSHRAEVENWILADVVIYIKNGLAAVEVNKFGPPGTTVPVLKLTWNVLGVYED